MTIVPAPVLDMPAGNPQMLAELAQLLISTGQATVGDAERDRQLLATSPALSAADESFTDFWTGFAADGFTRAAISARERIRAANAAIEEGGRAAAVLAEALALAQVTIAQAQQVATARAQQASLSPIPPDPITLWSDLYGVNGAVGTAMADAHAQATAVWVRLTQAAPHFVAPKPRPVDHKRPWWKRAIGATHVVLDAGGLVPGLGEIADGANGLIYLAEGDRTNAGLSFGAMVPVAGWGATGAKYAIKADRAMDAGRAAGHVVPPGIGNVTPPRIVEHAPESPPLIGGVGGGRGDAGYGGRNPFPPGGGDGSGGFGGGIGPDGPRGPVDDARRGAQLLRSGAASATSRGPVDDAVAATLFLPPRRPTP